MLTKVNIRQLNYDVEPVSHCTYGGYFRLTRGKWFEGGCYAVYPYLSGKNTRMYLPHNWLYVYQQEPRLFDLIQQWLGKDTVDIRVVVGHDGEKKPHLSIRTDIPLDRKLIIFSMVRMQLQPNDIPITRKVDIVESEIPNAPPFLKLIILFHEWTDTKIKWDDQVHGIGNLGNMTWLTAGLLPNEVWRARSEPSVYMCSTIYFYSRMDRYVEPEQRYGTSYQPLSDIWRIVNEHCPSS